MNLPNLPAFAGLSGLRGRLRRSPVVFVALLTSWTMVGGGTSTGLAQATPAQSSQADYLREGGAVKAAPADPAIAAAIGQVSAARMRETVEKLVGFGTRTTISSATPTPKICKTAAASPSVT